MSTLLIDLGNTRVKWAHLQGGRLSAQRACVYDGWTGRDFQRELFAPRHSAALQRKSTRTEDSGTLERILIASVAGTNVDRTVATAAHAAMGIKPEFVATSRRRAGVTTSYTEPWRLGVDRFIAVIGAHHLVRPRAACVIDVGTAMTLDLVDGRGQHLGGAIVPGPELMVASLLKNTSGIERRAQDAASIKKSAKRSRRGELFAHNTYAAIQQGARYAAAAVIDRAVKEAKEVLGQRPVVLLTGGAAETLRPLLRTPRIRSVPDLVLRGLAVLVEEKSR